MKFQKQLSFPNFSRPFRESQWGLVFTAYSVVFFCFTSCTFRSLALKSTMELLARGTEAVFEESDLQFAEESIASQLKALEILLKNEPTHPQLVLLTTQGFGAYAFLFLEEKDRERAKNFYERGKNYGLHYF